MTAIYLALAVSLQADKSGDIVGGFYYHSTNIKKKITFFFKSYASLRIKKLRPEKLRMFLIV
jgi:hypothetical protein